MEHYPHHCQEQRLHITTDSQSKEKIKTKNTTIRSHIHTNTTKENICHLHILQPPCTQGHNLFKYTNLNIAFRATNTSYNHLSNNTPQNKMHSSGIYRIKCKTCNGSAVGQTGRSIGIRHREHARYIKKITQFRHMHCIF